MIQVRAVGNPSARIMVVGDAPTMEDERKNEAFAGSTGWELRKMFNQVGIPSGDVFFTNALRRRPDPDWFPQTKKAITEAHIPYKGKMVLPVVEEQHKLLLREIELVKPKMIIAMGEEALWMLTGMEGIAKWRGSMLRTPDGIKVLPTYSIVTIFRQWELRPVVVQDLRRAQAYSNGQEWPEPEWVFYTRPSYGQVIATISALMDRAEEGPLKLSVDIETRAYNIACCGIAWSKHSALCIPFMELGKDHYWSQAEESEIVHALYHLFRHPNVLCVGQNFIYDCQYFQRSWGFYPARTRDTMLTHHVLFPGMQKSLDFICSFHNEQYVYWKDDGKTLDADLDEDKHWRYNCEDCVRTYEADESLQEVVDKMGLRKPHDFQQRMFHPVLKAMIKGVRVDRKKQLEMAGELSIHASELNHWIKDVVGYPLNVKSNKQMQAFFYEELALPKQYKRGAAGASCDSPSLAALVEKQPLLKPLVDRIEDLRSVEVFRNNFLADKRDKDGRMRCSYNIAGTKTFRFASRENAFGSGLNLQNIPKGDEE